MGRKAMQLPESRIWTRKQAASRLGLSIKKFMKKLPRLVQLGFPKMDEELEGFDSYRIEKFLDGRLPGDYSGDEERVALERIGNGKDQIAFC